MTKLLGKTVKIIATTNKFAEHHVGKTGVVTGPAPLGMVALTGVEGAVGEYWAETWNLEVVKC